MVKADVFYEQKINDTTKGNFIKRLEWSPDGQRLLVNTEQQGIEVYKLDQDHLERIHSFPSHELGFNDFCWYPWMNVSCLKESSCFLTTSKDVPIQLWEAESGQMRCCWIPKDHLDQIAHCVSVSFDVTGGKIITGGNGRIWIFDASRPGAESINSVKTGGKGKGMISTVNFRFDDTGVFATGSFNGTIGIYDLRTLSHHDSNDEDGNSAASAIQFTAHPQGVSQLQFTKSGWSVISSGRLADSICEWDLRMLTTTINSMLPVKEYELGLSARRNQRIYFDYWEDRLITGVAEDLILFEDGGSERICNFHDDVISSVSMNPLKRNLLASSSGTRHFQSDPEDPPIALPESEIKLSILTTLE